MPRYNNDGRTAKFIHTGSGGGGGGRGGGFQGGRKFNNDFTFKGQRHGGIHKKNRDPKIFQRLDDGGDAIMGGDPQPSGSGHRQGGRRGRREWRNKGSKNNMKQNDFIFGPNWHKVTILNGTSYDRDIILSSLAAQSRIPFIPVAYSITGTNTVFFVEDRTVAQSLAECSGKITVAENQQLKLRILPCNAPPTTNFDLNCETKVKAELERRYNGQLQTITLSNFGMSPELIRECFLPLNRTSVVIKLFSLLDPMLNNLVGLDLSNNRMYNLDGLGTLPKKAPNLKALNIGKNKFRDINVLDKVRGMQIIELILEENPVCNSFKDKDQYIRIRRGGKNHAKLNTILINVQVNTEMKTESLRCKAPVAINFDICRSLGASDFCLLFQITVLIRKKLLFIRSDVRKRFPKVTKLDGVDIPPPITFEVAEAAKMPEIRGSSFCNEEAKKVVLTFWEQFMSVYDSNDRQPLIQAYHETATMSMMASYSQQGHVSQMDPSKKLSTYLGDSRNLLRNPDKHRKYKLLHQGKTDIIEFLKRLPKTTHDPTSFVIDMPVAVENFILFNVAGLMKEREERNTPIRYFSRTFTVVPLNGGFVIVNEMYFITTATPLQVKGAFKQTQISATTIAAPAVAGPSSSAVIPATTTPAQIPATAAPRVFTEDEKRVMLASFAQQSGMNEDWSRKCLEQNNWDFNHSAFVFGQLKEQGKIPPDAFVK